MHVQNTHALTDTAPKHNGRAMTDLWIPQMVLSTATLSPSTANTQTAALLPCPAAVVVSQGVGGWAVRLSIYRDTPPFNES